LNLFYLQFYEQKFEARPLGAANKNHRALSSVIFIVGARGLNNDTPAKLAVIVVRRND